MVSLHQHLPPSSFQYLSSQNIQVQHECISKASSSTRHHSTSASRSSGYPSLAALGWYQNGPVGTLSQSGQWFVIRTLISLGPVWDVDPLCVSKKRKLVSRSSSSQICVQMAKHAHIRSSDHKDQAGSTELRCEWYCSRCHKARSQSVHRRWMEGRRRRRRLVRVAWGLRWWRRDWRAGNLCCRCFVGLSARCLAARSRLVRVNRVGWWRVWERRTYCRKVD